MQRRPRRRCCQDHHPVHRPREAIQIAINRRPQREGIVRHDQVPSTIVRQRGLVAEIRANCAVGCVAEIERNIAQNDRERSRTQGAIWLQTRTREIANARFESFAKSIV